MKPGEEPGYVSQRLSLSILPHYRVMMVLRNSTPFLRIAAWVAAAAMSTNANEYMVTCQSRISNWSLSKNCHTSRSDSSPAEVLSYIRTPTDGRGRTESETSPSLAGSSLVGYPREDSLALDQPHPQNQGSPSGLFQFWHKINIKI